jgi:hypothetical protein
VIANALFLTTVIFIAVGLIVLEECKFLIPYRSLLYYKYGAKIAVFAALAFGNLFAGILAISRHLSLKDTGRKLSHIEKQLRSGLSISKELSRRIAEKE